MNTIEYEQYYPFWNQLSREEKDLLEASIVTRSVSKGEVIASCDRACMGMATVLKGKLRVSIISEEGRQITLYHILENENCVTTASCVIRQISFQSLVTADVDTTFLVIPAAVFARISESNIYVKAYMYELLTSRFSTVVWVMEQILFKRMDQRLAGFLVRYHEKTGRNVISMTQEELANDINTAREVAARMLKQFAADDLVEVKRGKIILKDIEGLKNI